MQLNTPGTAVPSHLRVQTCTKLVMDTSDPDITFDDEGVCNYWHDYQPFAATLPTPADRERQLAETVERIRAASRGKAYDSVIGLSGGVDSSYLAYVAKQQG